MKYAPVELSRLNHKCRIDLGSLSAFSSCTSSVGPGFTVGAMSSENWKISKGLQSQDCGNTVAIEGRYTELKNDPQITPGHNDEK